MNNKCVLTLCGIKVYKNMRDTDSYYLIVRFKPFHGGIEGTWAIFIQIRAHV